MRFPLLTAAAFLAAFSFGPDARPEQRVRIVKIERSPQVPSPQPKVRVVSPKNGGSLFSMTPEIKLEVTGFELGVQTPYPGEDGMANSKEERPRKDAGAEADRKNRIANSEEGQHVHVIVDNGPYKAVYDVSKPIPLKGVGAGPHTLVVFPSRSYHESVKSEGAAHFVNFSVISGFWGDHPMDLSAPALIYSRPKGIYRGGDAENIMVDFYLRKVSLSRDGYKVRLSIYRGGTPVASEMFYRWRPALVQGLRSGEYTFRLTLIDPSGEEVGGVFGDVSRIIKVER